MGSPAAAGRRQNVHRRRKDSDDIFRVCFRDGHSPVERQQSEVSRVRRSRRISADSPQHLRKNGNPPAASHGSGGRREDRKIGEGGGLPLGGGQGWTGRQRAL